MLLPHVFSAIALCCFFSFCASTRLGAAAVVADEPKSQQETRQEETATRDSGGAPVATFRGNAAPVRGVVFKSDGREVVSTSDKDVCRWNTADSKEIACLKFDHANSVAIRPDLKRVAVAYHDDVALRDLADGRERFKVQPRGVWKRDSAFRPVFSAIAFSPDGRRLALTGTVAKPGGPHGYPGGIAMLLDAETGKELRRMEGMSTHVGTVAFSTDGKLLAAGTDGAGGELPEPAETLVWNASTGALLHILKFKDSIEWDLENKTLEQYSVAALTFDPQNKKLATAVSDGAVQIWDLEKGVVTQTLKGHTGKSGHAGVDKTTGRIRGRSSAVLRVVYSPDGNRIAAAGYDRTVRVWDVATGNEVRSFRFDTPAISALAFSPDGKQLAAGGGASKAGEVLIWRAPAN